MSHTEKIDPRDLQTNRPCDDEHTCTNEPTRERSRYTTEEDGSQRASPVRSRHSPASPPGCCAGQRMVHCETPLTTGAKMATGSGGTEF